MLTTVNIHEVPKEIYDKILLPEETHKTSRWKTIEVGSTQVTFFPLKGESHE